MDLNLQLVSNSNDRAKALEAFDDTKTGVKGLVDAGITTIPQIFVLPNQEEEVSPDESNSGSSCFKLPVIDLAEMNKNYDSLHRKQVVEEIKHACETWGFFKILNHGIPQDLMDEMVEGVRRFNEQSKEEKMKIYSREKMRKVRFNSNFDLYKAKAANWRDTLFCAWLQIRQIQKNIQQPADNEQKVASFHLHKHDSKWDLLFIFLIWREIIKNIGEARSFCSLSSELQNQFAVVQKLKT